MSTIRTKKILKRNLNKELYSDKLFKIWVEKNNLLKLEDYFINKYLKNRNGRVIEAGTGGGRIIFEIESMGFLRLCAFDYVEEMINYCNKKKKRMKSSVVFKNADATDLMDYEDETYDYLIYLQQILCFLEKEDLNNGLKEAYRIGKMNAVYIFSFLNWDSKLYNSLLSALINFVRFFRGEQTDKYRLPWLKIDGKFNWKFLNSNQPQNLWFKEKVVVELLKEHGFNILEIKNRVENKDCMGHIHIACTKA